MYTLGLDMNEYIDISATQRACNASVSGALSYP